MIVTYRPDGDAEQLFEFDPDKVRAVHAEAIEKRAGVAWDKWRENLLAGETRARRALLWHLLKTRHPTLKFEDVDYALGELTVELTRTELLSYREKTAASTAVPEDQRAIVLARLDQEIAQARDSIDSPAGGEGDEPVGKARSRPAGAVTASRSRRSSASAPGNSANS